MERRTNDMFPKYVGKSIHFRNKYWILRRLIPNMTYFKEHEFFRFEEVKQMSKPENDEQGVLWSFSCFQMTIHNFLTSYRKISTKKFPFSPPYYYNYRIFIFWWSWNRIYNFPCSLIPLLFLRIYIFLAAQIKKKMLCPRI